MDENEKKKQLMKLLDMDESYVDTVLSHVRKVKKTPSQVDEFQNVLDGIQGKVKSKIIGG